MAAAGSNLYEQLEDEALGKLFRRVAWIRVVLAPLLFLGLLVALYDASTWRLALLVAYMVAAIAFSWAEYRRVQRQGFSGNTLPRNMTFFLPAFPGILLATGGLEGPLNGIVLVIVFVLGLLVRGRVLAVEVVGLVITQWVLAVASTHAWIPDLIPKMFGGGSRAGSSDALVYAIALAQSLLIVWVFLIARALRGFFRGLFDRALVSRKEALEAHEEHARTLTTLTGEIAHELKNPLASVKGLAAMIEKDVTGRPAERLAVLRREVDRMQEILEQFLNFSRPLVPLALEEVELESLCVSVATMHEGLSIERGVAVRAREEASVRLRCDPRKMRQILINLVQNAIDASPQGTTVELTVDATADGAEVRVLDRGSGISPELSERAFEPGVTTKQNGSGLGLAIARQLARQHGGDLVLHPRDGGGTEAVVSIPREISAKTEAA